jgi:hypothetical protein
MKKQKKPSSLLTRLAKKRHKRTLRSKAKKAHRNGTGYKNLESE